MQEKEKILLDQANQRISSHINQDEYVKKKVNASAGKLKNKIIFIDIGQNKICIHTLWFSEI